MVPRPPADHPRRARPAAAAAPGARCSTPAAARAARCRSWSRYGEVQRDRARSRGRRAGPQPRPGRGRRSAAWRSCRGTPDSFDLITCLDVIEHTPDDRADARRAARGCRARAASCSSPCPPIRRCGRSRRGQPPLPPLLAGATLREAARGGGLDGGADELVQQPAARPGGGGPPRASGAAGTAQRLHATTSTLGPAWLNDVLERPLRARGRLAAARAHAAGRAVAAGGAAQARGP